MQLLLRRDQKSSLMGKAVFTLDVRAQMSEEEREATRKYKLGETVLYLSHDVPNGTGLLGLASTLAWKAVSLNIQVKDLERGKTIECKDIVEMLAIEEHIKEAARTFVAVLAAAATFGGEEEVAL
jgi:hypothetical protein